MVCLVVCLSPTTGLFSHVVWFVVVVSLFVDMCVWMFLHIFSVILFCYPLCVGCAIPLRVVVVFSLLFVFHVVVVSIAFYVVLLFCVVHVCLLFLGVCFLWNCISCFVCMVSCVWFVVFVGDAFLFVRLFWLNLVWCCVLCMCVVPG